MRILVSGGAGFIGSQFVTRRLSAGDDVVVLDKLTYSGNRANLAGRRARVPSRATSPIREAVADGRERLRLRSSTSPPRRTSTARFSTATDFGRAEFRGTQVLLEHVREAGIATRAGLDRRGLRRSRGGRLVDARPTPLRPSSPYSAAKAARRPARPGVRAHVRRQRVDHARLEHVRAEPVPGEAHPALRHERARRRAAAALRRRPPGPRLAPRRGSLRGHRARARARARRARSTTSAAATSARTSTSRERDPRAAPAPTARCSASVADRPGHDRRYSLDTSKLPQPRLVAAAVGFEDGPPRDRRVVPRAAATGGSRSSPASTATYYERQYAERLANATSV